MKFVRKLMESKPALERIPDQSLLIGPNETPSERIQVTRGKEYVFVYASTGKSFGLKMGVIPGEKAAYYWVNPRNGEQSIRYSIWNSGVQTFTPPSKGYGLDWIMVLEAN